MRSKWRRQIDNLDACAGGFTGRLAFTSPAPSSREQSPWIHAHVKRGIQLMTISFGGNCKRAQTTGAKLPLHNVVGFHLCLCLDQQRLYVLLYRFVRHSCSIAIDICLIHPSAERDKFAGVIATSYELFTDTPRLTYHERRAFIFP